MKNYSGNNSILNMILIIVLISYFFFVIIPPCAVVSSSLRSEVNALSIGLKDCLKAVEKIPKSHKSFHSKMGNFLTIAEATVKKINRDHAIMEKNFKKVCVFLGEKPDDCSPDTVFGVIQRFSEAFEVY